MKASIDSLTDSIIGAAFEVSNTLGAGFLEKVYERALLRELKLQGIPPNLKSISPSSTRARTLEISLPA